MDIAQTLSFTRNTKNRRKMRGKTRRERSCRNRDMKHRYFISQVVSFGHVSNTMQYFNSYLYHIYFIILKYLYYVMYLYQCLLEKYRNGEQNNTRNKLNFVKPKNYQKQLKLGLAKTPEN